jgi:hypothetical protein
MSRERRTALAHRVLARVVNSAVTCVVACALIGMLGACDGAVADPASNPAPAVAVTVRDANATIARGDSLFTTVSIVRASGSSSPVVMSAENVPAGVTVSFLPTLLPAGVTSAVVGIVIDQNATTPTAAIVIRATATDQPSGSATVGITVIPPSIVLATGASSVTAIRGGPAVSTTVYVARISSAFGAIAFVADSLPAGGDRHICVAQYRRPCHASVTDTDRGAGVAVGSYSVRVRASMAGVSDALIRVSLTVLSPGDRGFDLSAVTPTVVLQAGQSATASVGVQRFGDFTGPVSLTVEGGQFGISSGTAQNTSDAVPSSLTVSVNSLVAAGEYTVQVRGRASDLADRTVPLRVRVVAGFSLSATTVTIPRGSVGTSSVSVVRTNGYAAPVTLTVVKLPAYLSASFNPAVTTGLASNLIITAAQNAPAGATQVEVQASGPNAEDRTLVIGIVIPP